MQNDYTLAVVARVQSPYKEKFGIPRQPGLAPSVQAKVVLVGEYNQADCVAGLADSSHIWLQFVFHQSLEHKWRPKVRPPRLGGNQSVGVFATRSPVRPSAIGLSVVKLESIVLGENVELLVSGIDLVDGTPVLDIKPYIPYVDKLDHAHHGFAQQAPELCTVEFAPECLALCLDHQALSGENLKQMLIEILQQDPRPAYQKKSISDKTYGMKFLQFNVRWRYQYAATSDAIVNVDASIAVEVIVESIENI